MEEKDIRDICRIHQIHCSKITKTVGSFGKELFFIDDKYLIRTSRQQMSEELYKINRIKDLKHVPKILYASDQSSSDNRVYYLILECLPGRELFTEYYDLNDQNIHDIGVRTADFLSDLHHIKGDRYDIGHYIPIIPGYDKSWRSGHEIYWDYIYSGLKEIQLSNSFQQLLELAYKYISTNISSLDFENGPSLLHNDFHYKNIIVHNNAFSGVIDWECSQYGEEDFDLIHLFHWSLFSPAKDLDMMQMLNTIFLRYMKSRGIPMMEKRLTIYLLEHDFIQVLWSEGKRAGDFVPRIEWWLSGKLEKQILKLLESL